MMTFFHFVGGTVVWNRISNSCSFQPWKIGGRAQYTEIGVAPQLDEGWSVTLNLATFFFNSKFEGALPENDEHFWADFW